MIDIALYVWLDKIIVHQVPLQQSVINALVASCQIGHDHRIDVLKY